MKGTTQHPTPRESILMDYAMDDSGRIINPGKFEGEPIFAPYFWQLGLDGMADRDDGTTFTFRFAFSHEPDLSLRAEWPELGKWLGNRRTLQLREDSQGFVHCS